MSISGALVATVSLTSCQADVDDSKENARSASQAIVQNDFYSMSYFFNAHPTDTTLSTLERSTLASGAQVFGDISAREIVLDMGSRAGALYAWSQLWVSGSTTTVNGNITSGGPANIVAAPIVNGTVSSNVPTGTARAYHWSYQYDHNPVLTDMTIVQPQPLAPGAYLNVSVQNKLFLRSGLYTFDILSVDEGGELVIDSSQGPVQLIHVGAGAFNFKGKVTSADGTIPQLIVHTRHNNAFHGPLTLGGTFQGALVAPEAHVRVAPSSVPGGHRAFIHSRNVTVENGAVIKKLPFDWSTLIPSAARPLNTSLSVHDLPKPAADTPLHVTKDGVGARTSTVSPGRTVTFKLPTKYPVTGGLIGNGTLTFTFRTPAGQNVTCTYRGGASSATPTTEVELNKARMLNFVSCSDGLAASASRQGTQFTTTVAPVPGYSVTVNSPVRADQTCSEELSLLTPEETMTMRQGFSWSTARAVAATNPDGKQALYYAWVYVRGKTDWLNLRKLYIHVLNRPLFNEELDALAGHCGSLSNPGDGSGTFVPVVIPGATYNRLIEALTASNIQGDRVIFDSVIIRQPPAAARNANGSIRLDHLVNSGFRYLHYEPRPLAHFNDMQFEGGASRAFVSVIQFVGETARNVGQLVTDGLALIDRLFRGTVNVTLHMTAVNPDPIFNVGNLPAHMVRGWGPRANQPLGANGMEVSILQKFLDSPIPSTSRGYTDGVGRVSIDAVDGATTRGTGLCIELKTAAAQISDFLLPTMICDLRGFTADEGQNVTNFKLRRLTNDQELWLKIWNTRLFGLYEADDAYRYAVHVLGVTPKRARITSGYWADTFTSHKDGRSRLYAPCLNYADQVPDMAVGTALLAGLVATPVVGTAAAVFTAVIAQTDIMMGVNSKLRANRMVMSHEYGHYILCALAKKGHSGAVDKMVANTILDGDDKSVPMRIANEAFADWITGQVVGGADYSYFGANRVTSGAVGGDYCVPSLQPCWDANLKGMAANADDSASIGRIATLLHDVWDGRSDAKGQHLAGNGDVWTQSLNKLVYSSATYGSRDAAVENVAIPASAASIFGQEFGRAVAGGTLIDTKPIYAAVNTAMRSSGVNWCNRCRVMALHTPSRPADDEKISTLFNTCISDTMLKSALLDPPPEASGRIDAATCKVCGTGLFSNDAGQCVFCDGTIVGNRCVRCPSDVVLDGVTIPFGVTQVFNTTQQAPGDTCPSYFWAEVRNPQFIFSRGGKNLNARPAPATLTSTQCNRAYEISFARANTSAEFITSTVLGGTGSFVRTCGGATCVDSCNNLPQYSLVTSDFTHNGAVRFGMPADSTKQLTITAWTTLTPPR